VLGTSFHVESRYLFLYSFSFSLFFPLLVFVVWAPSSSCSCLFIHCYCQSLQEAETEERDGPRWRGSRVASATDQRRDREARKRVTQARSFPRHSRHCSAHYGSVYTWPLPFIVICNHPALGNSKDRSSGVRVSYSCVIEPGRLSQPRSDSQRVFSRCCVCSEIN